VLDEYNEKAQSVYNECGLIKCPNCSRTFNIESVEKHMKGCNKGGSSADPFEAMKAKKKKTERPMGIMCYICGREYFSKSIGIHIEKCKEKFLIAEK